MRINLIAVVFVVLLTGIAVGQATENTEGTVLAIDWDAGTLLLSNDILYILPNNFADLELEIGDQVKILWNMVDEEALVESVAVIATE